MKETVILACDHAGFEYKEEIKRYLLSKGEKVEDVGTFSAESCDYPDFAEAACKKVIETGGRGILVCGTGVGMAMCANKVPGIRACVCSETFSIRYSRMHNDCNVLCFGARVVSLDTAKELTDIFLTKEFEGGRHQGRVDKINAIR